MHEPLTILLVCHGFPPRESAGTERHTEALAHELKLRGHRVHVLAATRAPGRPQYERIESEAITRVVNNIATRSLSDGESDPIIDRIAAEIDQDLRPDIVHVHHTQFLSSTMKFSAPTVVTLHDHWAWCASGGLGLRSNGDLCQGPVPVDCAECHAHWRPGPSPSARLLTRAASAVSPWVNPDTLHRLYRGIPARLRPSPVRGEPVKESPAAADHRNRMVLDWYRRADTIISPSDHLAELASAQGLGPVQVIRHGLDDSWFGPRQPISADAPFVHIGTIAHHKGTDLVVAAHRALKDGPELELHGPILDPESALGHPVGRRLEPSGVQSRLRQARALVLGSRWTENAPLIVIEARAAGCPVIAPRIGGIPELITEGVDGILYEPGDIEGLTAAMRALLEQPMLEPSPPPRFTDQVDRLEAVYRQALRQTA